MNKENIDLLLQEFRLWTDDWKRFDNDPKNNYKPENIGSFIEDLSKRYKVKIK